MRHGHYPSRSARKGVLAKGERDHFQPPFGGREPDPRIVHDQTIKYIRQDFEESGHLYSPHDRERVATLLAGEPRETMK